MAIPSLGLAPYNWWSEASTGVASGRNTQTTKFAFPITTGMSFNRTLWQLTGRQIGREARAMMNAGNGYSTFWAPVINLAREPRWGASTRMRPPYPCRPPYTIPIPIPFECASNTRWWRVHLKTASVFLARRPGTFVPPSHSYVLLTRYCLLRSPGRNIETPGEDPYHSGEYATYYVQGMEQA